MSITVGFVLPGNIRLAERVSTGELFDSFRAQVGSSGSSVFCKVQRDDLDDERSGIAFKHLGLWRRLVDFSDAALPRILDEGELNGLAYLVTEWVEGKSLHDLGMMLDGAARIPPAFPKLLLRQGLAGLAALHQIHFWHGDLSPSNILVSSDYERIWLIDLAPSMTSSGKVIATRAWAAPEVLSGANSGPSSDLYSLGQVIAAFCARTGSPAPLELDLLTSPDPQKRPRNAAEALEVIDIAGIMAHFPAPPIPAMAAPACAMAPPTSATAPGFSLLRKLFTLSKAPKPRSPSAAQEPTTDKGARSADTRLGTDWSQRTESASAGSTSVPASEQARTEDVANWSSRTGISNIPIRSSATLAPLEADFIVMGPTLVGKENSFSLELWVGPSAKSDELRERASDRGRLVERGARAKIELPGSVMITAIMTLPGFEVVNNTEQIHWDGTIRNTAFIVSVAPEKAPGRYAGLVKLVIGRVPLGMVTFYIEIADGRKKLDPVPGQLSTGVRRHRTAFASYSRKNTAEVFKRVQAIRAGEIDIFVDIANLRGGERWANVLMHEIVARDVFFLFWSREAAKSTWVEREWKEALHSRGLDFICPIPLEDPRFAEPPRELRDLHFNDWCLAIIRGEEAFASGNPLD